MTRCPREPTLVRWALNYVTRAAAEWGCLKIDGMQISEFVSGRLSSTVTCHLQGDDSNPNALLPGAFPPSQSSLGSGLWRTGVFP